MKSSVLKTDVITVLSLGVERSGINEVVKLMVLEISGRMRLRQVLTLYIMTDIVPSRKLELALSQGNIYTVIARN